MQTQVTKKIKTKGVTTTSQISHQKSDRTRPYSCRNTVSVKHILTHYSTFAYISHNHYHYCIYITLVTCLILKIFEGISCCLCLQINKNYFFLSRVTLKCNAVDLSSCCSFERRFNATSIRSLKIKLWY